LSDTDYDHRNISGPGGTPQSKFSTMMSLSDPDGANPLVAALLWLQGTMLGTVATVIAVIAVAGVGALMLTGRLDWRQGATVVFGCFVLFGATNIAAGIRQSFSGTEALERSSPPPPIPATVVQLIVPKPRPAFDPYAGAAPARPQQPIH